MKENQRTSKVYIVIYTYNYDYEIEGVFSTKEKADEYVGSHMFYRIKEVLLDDPCI